MIKIKLSEKITERILQIMAEKRMNRVELADASGIHVANLSKLLLNQRSWGLHHIEAVATGLGVSAEYLLGGVEDAKPLIDMVEQAVQEAESNHLAQEIAPKRNKLIETLFRYCGFSGEKPTVEMVRKYLPLLSWSAAIIYGYGGYIFGGAYL